MGDRIGLGILGLGRWAHAHGRAAARSDLVEIVNCHARRPETRSAFMGTFGVEREATTLEELLHDPSVQAVVISTPNDVHVEHARAAVEAGKPVLVDKPISVEVAEGLDLWRAATSGARVGVAHHARRLAGNRAARRWIEGGEAGQVQVARADFSNPRGAAMGPDAWHRTARGSEAGVLIQVGIHQVDNLLYLLGPARRVQARFAHRELGPDMPDAAVVALEHTDGALSTVTSSWTTPGHYSMDLLATGGNLSFRLNHGQWTSGEVDQAGILTLDTGDGPRPHPWHPGDPLTEQLDELGRSARDGTPMEVDIVEGLRAMAVVQAAVESHRTGRRVEIIDLYRSAGATVAELEALVAI